MTIKNLYIATGATAAAFGLGILLAMIFSNTLITAINTVCFFPALLFFSGGAFFVRGHVKNMEFAEMTRELERYRNRSGKVTG